jgi:hypothetical protein
MVRFLVELIHSNSNPRFDLTATYLRLIILSVVCDVFVDRNCSLNDFVNFKIKSTQSFECAHRGRICACVFIEGECSYVYEYLRLYCVTF